MTRFILDTGAAGLYLDRKRGVLERATAELEMKTIGRPIGQNDITIAAVAFSPGNTTIVTRDGDLSAVPDLTVDN